MRKSISLLTLLAVVGLMTGGCANAEKKLGRGLSNTAEIVRMGEFRRSMEQSAFLESPDTAYGVGFVKGMNRTLARTGIGIYEVLTFPFPKYEPICTDYLKPNPVYPDGYEPGVLDDSMFTSDSYTGFSGGEIAPFIPGSRFRVFDEQ